MRQPGGEPTLIQLTINTCAECPKVKVERTFRAGYALDYYCKLLHRKIMGYIEWPSEMRPPPQDCPIRVDKPPLRVLDNRPEIESRFTATAEELDDSA